MNYKVEDSLDYISKSLDEKWNFKCFLSTQRDIVSTFESPEEVGSSLIVLELLQKYLSKASLEKIIGFLSKNIDDNWTFHFFLDKYLLPNDTDTTSWWLSTFLDLEIINKEEAEKQAEKIAKNTDDSGIIQTYYKESWRERSVDPTAIVNILHFLYKVKLDEKKFNQSYNFIKNIIENEQFRKPWRYYFSPWMFIFFLQRLSVFNDEIKWYLSKIINDMKIPINGTIDMACSIIVKKYLEIDCENEEKALISLADLDWSFPYDSIYKYGSKNLYFWSKVISTAFALHALLK